MKGILTAGVDIGSTASKCVLLLDGNIVGKAAIPVGAGTTGPARAMAEAFGQYGVSAAEISRICATGYGRNSLREAHMEMSELSCHTRGAYSVFPDVRTIIDIGGQDAKVMRVGPNGRLMNFVMNDKCAAGTGRFLEVMARVLEVRTDQLAELDAQSTQQVSISSTCTVFAESEVISQLANEVPARDIIAGIHRSVASRVGGLARRGGVEPQVVMTGGVACNQGVVRALEATLGVSIATSELAQYMGALGAALYAAEQPSSAS